MTAVMPAFQASLLDLATDIGLGGLGGTVTRTELSDGAWVDVRRGWVSGADALFERLAADVPWRAERRPMYDRVVDVPRLLCFYGAEDPLPHPSLVGMRDALDAHYATELGEPFVTAACACTATAATAWLGTVTASAASRTEDTMVAIVSLGDPRALLLRPNGGGAGRTIRHEIGHGDLLVMGGSCQRTWEHAVPKTARPVGPRISIQFRPFDVR